MKPTSDGTWSVRTLSHAGSSGYTLEPLGLADDITAADGVRWLTYRQAVEQALGKAKATATAKAPLTVREAGEAYVAKLRSRGTGRPGEVATAFDRQLGKLAALPVATLDHGTLQTWAQGISRGTAASLRAALAMTPVAVRPSSTVLSALKDHRPTRPRNLVQNIMAEDEVSTVLVKARRHDRQFGLLTAVLAATGCRPSQIVRCRKADLLAREAVLVVPPSTKGRPGRPKPVSRMPLDPALVRELEAWAKGKVTSAPLFSLPRNVRRGFGWQADGERPWMRNDWGSAAKAADIGRRLYDLRHAAIVRMLLAGVPIRVVAAKLDTSSAIIERHYSRFIGDPADDLVRRALTTRRLQAVT